MKLGAHQSISGGIHNAVTRADRIQLSSVQIFTKAPQSWKEPELSAKQIHDFQTARTQAGFRAEDWVVHASYLVNTCSENPDTRTRAVAALIAEANRCDALNIPHLVFHPGSPGKQGVDVGISLVALAITQILAASADVQLLIENTAGSGKSIGHTFEQIRQIIELVPESDRVGVCFDTAHAFAAGYNIAEEKTAPLIFDEFDRIIGLERLKVIHLNDSKTKLGSRVDRHERIGRGRIGEPLFRWLVNAPFAEHLPGILETPLEKDETYAADIQRLRSFRR
ncbi:MAG: deoxyribonuclease IV [Deltaproteobacteria bacterium]|nr:deoxyribonuclease IV [Deltaproteobacteria bacterium]MBN2672811.1 deoxyribonuclease IV [Deltaproteobacteria bacterium]